MVSYAEFQDLLASNGMELNDQVLITLMRQFDKEQNGMVAYEEFLALAS